MILISHRGNTIGPNPNNENKPEVILKTLEDFDCEIDLWLIDGHLFLGHDEPQYAIGEDFLNNKGLWIHAKNIEALDFLNGKKVNYFWHEEDKATITSLGYIWCYPGTYCKNGITVELNYKSTVHGKLADSSIAGICTDNPLFYLKETS
jgi:hypothetical protein|tara:strand:- start:115 stop:561 length:447 start_codon:yes stop_codon:yes gene_type:complete